MAPKPLAGECGLAWAPRYTDLPNTDLPNTIPASLPDHSPLRYENQHAEPSLLSNSGCGRSSLDSHCA